MKLQIVIHTPVGVFKSAINEVSDVEMEEVDKLKEIIKKGAEYLNLVGENGEDMIFPKELVKNSVVSFNEISE